MKRWIFILCACLAASSADAQTLIKKGSTDVTRYVMLVDSVDGTPETAVTITGIDLQYTRNRSAAATKVDATALTTAADAHADNQAIAVDATSSPGLYRVDWPDAAFATGADKVILVVSATGVHPAIEEIQLVDFDPQDAVRLGLTAMPNAAADAAGGLPISDAGGLDMDAQRADVAAILVDTGTTLQAEVDGIQADTEDIQARLPAALTAGGNMKSDPLAINGVDTTSVTTINANLGTTQPVNFTGTAGSALVKTDVTDWAATAVATPNTAGYPVVTVKDGTGTGEIDTSSGAIVRVIEKPRALVTTVLEGIAATSFDTAALPVEPATLADWTITIRDVSSSTVPKYSESRRVTSTQAAVSGGITVNFDSAFGFTVVAGDIIEFYPPDLEVLTRLPNATAGASGGVFIAGTNAQTTVTSGFGAGTITATSFAAGAIDAAAIAADAIGAAELADGAIDAATLAADAITAAKVAADVTTELLAPIMSDAHAEPTGVPTATESLATKIGRLSAALRNRLVVNNGTGKKQFYDDANLVVWEKDVTDAAGVYDETEANAP